MRVSAALPTGVAGLFFDSARRRRRIEEALVGRLEEGGFSEVILPVVDYLDPYEALPRAVRRDEMYRFVDRDGEVLALRADFTPMLARLLAPRLASLALPLKLFYRGDVLRCQEERAGRERELYQLGAELLGLAGAAAERQALRAFLELLTLAGSGGRVRVVLGFAGALDELFLAAAKTVPPAELVAAVVRRERQVARRAGAALREVVEAGVPEDPAALGAEAEARLEALATLGREVAAEWPGVEVGVDLAEFADQTLAPELRRTTGVHAYYDGLVFRAYGAGAEQLGGGGRYDQLFRRLGAEVTAAGFCLSLDRLGEPG